MSDVQVIIVGGGPVGLFLGCRLAQLGVSLRVLERRPHPLQHSRSIGIHPPALEKLGGLGLADALIKKGVQVRRGHAFANTRYLGSLDFASCPAPYHLRPGTAAVQNRDAFRKPLMPTCTRVAAARRDGERREAGKRRCSGHFSTYRRSIRNGQRRLCYRLRRQG